MIASLPKPFGFKCNCPLLSLFEVIFPLSMTSICKLCKCSFVLITVKETLPLSVLVIKSANANFEKIFKKYLTESSYIIILSLKTHWKLNSFKGSFQRLFKNLKHTAFSEHFLLDTYFTYEVFQLKRTTCLKAHSEVWDNFWQLKAF